MLIYNYRCAIHSHPSREKARYTAARECHEETLGIFGKTKHLASTLAEFEENNVFKVSNILMTSDQYFATIIMLIAIHR